MSEQTKDSTHGLSCPRCGGMVPVPEGQALVQCPFCEMRSIVQGERGVRRYQVPCRMDRSTAMSGLARFLAGSMAIARDAKAKAQITEAFIAYLPFWTVWGRMLGWVFGEKQVGSGDNKRYEPREKKIVEELTWTGAACDVGEFGVTSVQVSGMELQPYNPEELHRAGLVFEPVGSPTEARQAAETNFQNDVRAKAGLDRVSQVFIRTVRPQFGLVYMPLWVIRYTYRGRAFQVVLDGYSGEVLYGKAPGNTLYRAAVLVGGMAAGAVLAVDVSAAIASAALNSNSDDAGGALLFALGAFVAGLGVMGFAYNRFRYGEQYEYRRGGGEMASLMNSLNMVRSVTKLMRD